MDPRAAAIADAWKAGRGRTMPVLILGESGVGKEYVARSMAERAGLAFHAINCAALPGELVESELFGHARGAFTGAHGARNGFFSRAGAGVAFLDEIAKAPLSTQAKLLRVIERRESRAVGADDASPVRAVIVLACSERLESEVAHGRFLADLWYRIRTLSVSITPLRSRAGDLSRLAIEFARANGATLDSAALSLICGYRWPGNVRELKHAIGAAAILSGPEITLDALAAVVPDAIAPARAAALSLAAERPDGFTQSEYETRTGLSRSTAHERLVSLWHAGVVERSLDGRVYRYSLPSESGPDSGESGEDQ